MWLYRYSSKWLDGTLQATVSWNCHRRQTANMPLVFHSPGADGYDMDYTDSKSIRPRSWVCTGLVNCLWDPIYDSVLCLLLPLCYSAQSKDVFFSFLWGHGKNKTKKTLKAIQSSSWWLKFWFFRSQVNRMLLPCSVLKGPHALILIYILYVGRLQKLITIN